MSQASESARGAWLGLEGQVCVVTGAGSGIGAETARHSRRPAPGSRFWTVTGFGDCESPRKSSAAAGARSACRPTSRRADTVAAAADRIQTELGPCRVLVNNAAIRHRGALLDIDLDAWNRVLAVNLTGALICTQAFAAADDRRRPRRQHRPRRVHPRPPSADRRRRVQRRQGRPRSCCRACSPLELAPHRIRSNVVSPGLHAHAGQRSRRTAIPRRRQRARQDPAGPGGDPRNWPT